ncbi:MAG: hypothetical protein JKY53_09305, partial [Flavobacteriales bacterium]|nr:hypothetical protein [Flavobacteriales bacterium]
TQEESTQRKEKENKVNKRKVKGKENAPSKSSLESENSKGADGEKEKGSAKKENGVADKCKEVFLNTANGYYWEQQDSKALIQILEKINHSFGGNLTPGEVHSNFGLFIENLPKYWRTKKFTLPLLNRNFNEIITEIQTQNTDGKQTSSKFGRHAISDLAERASTFGR